MSVPPKPEGYSSVSPYLMAEGAQRVIDFLKQVFGAAARTALRPGGGLKLVG